MKDCAREKLLRQTVEALAKDGESLVAKDLSRQDLRGINLRGADLRKSHLVSTNLAGADLFEADLRYCNLTGAKFCNDDGSNPADVRRTRVCFTSLSGIQLTMDQLLTWCKENQIRIVDRDRWKKVGHGDR